MKLGGVLIGLVFVGGMLAGCSAPAPSTQESAPPDEQAGLPQCAEADLLPMFQGIDVALEIAAAETTPFPLDQLDPVVCAADVTVNFADGSPSIDTTMALVGLSAVDLQDALSGPLTDDGWVDDGEFTGGLHLWESGDGATGLQFLEPDPGLSVIAVLDL